MPTKRQQLAKSQSISSDIVEGVAWGLLVAAIAAAMLFILFG